MGGRVDENQPGSVVLGRSCGRVDELQPLEIDPASGGDLRSPQFAGGAIHRWVVNGSCDDDAVCSARR